MDGMAWAASAMAAARTRLEIATQNLANVSTEGFHRLVARGFLTPVGVAISRRTSAQGGALRHTGRALDFAILGPGSFRVRDRSGHVSATRNGAFVRALDGTLRDATGHVVLGAKGEPLVSKDPPLQARDFGLPAGSVVRSGFLEAPSVNAVSEMIDVVAAQRSFESAEKAVEAIDGTRRKAADAARVK
jgi:flagellar basal body rod protein FlgG